MSVKKQSIALIPLLLLIAFISPSQASAAPKMLKNVFKKKNALGTHSVCRWESLITYNG